MFNKRMLLTVLAGGVVLLALVMPQARNANAASVTVPYAGRLADEAGQPVTDGAYDFTFALYDAETGGALLWSEAQPGVKVTGGDFAAVLGSVNPVSAATMDGGRRWLSVGVRGPGESEFTALTPRQLVSADSTASPAGALAGAACAHDHLGEVWNANLSWANAGLRINNSANGPALWGYNTGGGNGVRGESTTGLGVYGWSDSNSGVVGRSQAKNGVEGYSSASDVWAGVYGEAPRYGVFGRSTMSGWYGVFSDGNMYTTGDLGVVGSLTVGGLATFNGGKVGYVVEIAQNDDTVALEAGDIVVISGVGPAVVGEIPVIKVRRALTGETSAVVGVVDQLYVPAPANSEAVANGEKKAESIVSNASIAPGGYLTIVTLGSFKAIKVDVSYGAIAPGDLLVASPNPGYAMRAPASPKPGTIIGKALGALSSGTGVIPVMITLQ